MARSDWYWDETWSKWRRRPDEFYVERIDESNWELFTDDDKYIKLFDEPLAAMDYADTHYPMEGE